MSIPNRPLFSLRNVQQHLFEQFDIPPELVGWETNFRDDLSLTGSDLQALIRYLTAKTGIVFPTNPVHHPSDVFDLMVYVLLRSTEYTDVETCFSALLYPILELSPDEFRPFGVALLHQLNLN